MVQVNGVSLDLFSVNVNKVNHLQTIISITLMV